MGQAADDSSSVLDKPSRHGAHSAAQNRYQSDSYAPSDLQHWRKQGQASTEEAPQARHQKQTRRHEELEHNTRRSHDLKPQRPEFHGASHVVNHNDTLSQIAKNHLPRGASNADVYRYVHEIAKANGLKDPNIIRDGQHLRIPEHLLAKHPIQHEPRATQGDRRHPRGPKGPGNERAQGEDGPDGPAPPEQFRPGQPKPGADGKRDLFGYGDMPAVAPNYYDQRPQPGVRPFVPGAPQPGSAPQLEYKVDDLVYRPGQGQTPQLNDGVYRPGQDPQPMLINPVLPSEGSPTRPATQPYASTLFDQTRPALDSVGPATRPIEAPSALVADTDAKAIKNAIDPGLFGADKNRADDILKNKSDAERAVIDSRFQELYGKNLDQFFHEKLSGNDLEKTLGFMRKDDDVAGRRMQELSAAIQERGNWVQGRDSNVIEKNVRDLLSMSTSKQLDDMDTAYRAAHPDQKQGLFDAIGNSWLSGDTKQVAAILRAGSDNRTDADTRKLADLAYKNGNLDMFKESMAMASPAVRDAFLADKGAEWIVTPFSKPGGFASGRDTTLGDQALDAVRYGKVDTATEIRQDTGVTYFGTSYQGIDGAVKSMSDAQRQMYLNGQKLANGGGVDKLDEAAKTEAKQYYDRTHTALNSASSWAGGGVDMARWESMIAHKGDDNFIASLADEKHTGNLWNVDPDKFQKRLDNMTQAQWEDLKHNPDSGKEFETMVRTMTNDEVSVGKMVEAFNKELAPDSWDKVDKPKAPDADKPLVERLENTRSSFSWAYSGNNDVVGAANAVLNSTQAEKDGVLKDGGASTLSFLSQEQRAVVLNALKQGEMRAEDTIRALQLGYGDPSLTVAAINGIGPKDMPKAAEAFATKYGGVSMQDSVLSSLSGNAMAQAERAFARGQSVDRQLEVTRQQAYAERSGWTASWANAYTGTGAQVDNNLNILNKQYSEYQKYADRLNPDNSAALQSYLLDRNATVGNATDNFADSRETAKNTGIIIGSTIATAGLAGVYALGGAAVVGTGVAVGEAVAPEAATTGINAFYALRAAQAARTLAGPAIVLGGTNVAANYALGDANYRFSTGEAAQDFAIGASLALGVGAGGKVIAASAKAMADLNEKVVAGTLKDVLESQSRGGAQVWDNARLLGGQPLDQAVSKGVSERVQKYVLDQLAANQHIDQAGIRAAVGDGLIDGQKVSENLYDKLSKSVEAILKGKPIAGASEDVLKAQTEYNAARASEFYASQLQMVKIGGASGAAFNGLAAFDPRQDLATNAANVGEGALLGAGAALTLGNAGRLIKPMGNLGYAASAVGYEAARPYVNSAAEGIKVVSSDAYQRVVDSKVGQFVQRQGENVSSRIEAFQAARAERAMSAGIKFDGSFGIEPIKTGGFTLQIHGVVPTEFTNGKFEYIKPNGEFRFHANNDSNWVFSRDAQGGYWFGSPDNPMGKRLEITTPTAPAENVTAAQGAAEPVDVDQQGAQTPRRTLDPAANSEALRPRSAPESETPRSAFTDTDARTLLNKGFAVDPAKVEKVALDNGDFKIIPKGVDPNKTNPFDHFAMDFNFDGVKGVHQVFEATFTADGQLQEARLSFAVHSSTVGALSDNYLRLRLVSHLQGRLTKDGLEFTPAEPGMKQVPIELPERRDGGLFVYGVNAAKVTLKGAPQDTMRGIGRLEFSGDAGVIPPGVIVDTATASKVVREYLAQKNNPLYSATPRDLGTWNVGKQTETSVPVNAGDKSYNLYRNGVWVDLNDPRDPAVRAQFQEKYDPSGIKFGILTAPYKADKALKIQDFAMAQKAIFDAYNAPGSRLKEITSSMKSLHPAFGASEEGAVLGEGEYSKGFRFTLAKKHTKEELVGELDGILSDAGLGFTQPPATSGLVERIVGRTNRVTEVRDTFPGQPIGANNGTATGTLVKAEVNLEGLEQGLRQSLKLGDGLIPQSALDDLSARLNIKPGLLHYENERLVMRLRVGGVPKDGGIYVPEGVVEAPGAPLNDRAAIYALAREAGLDPVEVLPPTRVTTSGAEQVQPEIRGS